MMSTTAAENEEKVCLDCGKPLGPGKLGKKYCDEYCKSNYHNRQNREKKTIPAISPNPEPPKRKLPEVFERIHEIMWNNREILKDICDEEDKATRIRMRNLLGRGFNPKYMTSQSEPAFQSGHVYNFCYEYGYREDNDGMAIVIYRPREIYF
jgi:hypothetical protein